MFYIRFYDVDGYIEVRAASLKDAEKIAELLGVHSGIGWIEEVEW